MIDKNYTEDLRKLETNDPGHADTFNPLFEKLINNDAYLNAKAKAIDKIHTSTVNSNVVEINTLGLVTMEDLQEGIPIKFKLNADATGITGIKIDANTTLQVKEIDGTVKTDFNAGYHAIVLQNDGSDFFEIAPSGSGGVSINIDTERTLTADGAINKGDLISIGESNVARVSTLGDGLRFIDERINLGSWNGATAGNMCQIDDNIWLVVYPSSTTDNIRYTSVVLNENNELVVDNTLFSTETNYAAYVTCSKIYETTDNYYAVVSFVIGTGVRKIKLLRISKLNANVTDEQTLTNSITPTFRNSMCRVTDTNVVLFGGDDSNTYAEQIIFNPSDNTISIASSETIFNYDTEETACVQLGENQVAFSYIADNSNDPILVLLTRTSDTNFDVGTLRTVITSADTIAIEKISDTEVVVMYLSSGSMRLSLNELSGTTWSEVASLVTSNVENPDCRFTKLTPNIFLVTAHSTALNNYVYNETFNIENGVITRLRDNELNGLLEPSNSSDRDIYPYIMGNQNSNGGVLYLLLLGNAGSIGSVVLRYYQAYRSPSGLALESATDGNDFNALIF